MHLFEAAILGLIQGITELLPISSSGHLLLIPYLSGVFNTGLDFSFQDTNFDVILHIATFLAITWSYRREIWEVLSYTRKQDNKFLFNMALTILPSLALGGALFVLGDDVVKQPWLTAVMLIFVGILLIYVDLRPKTAGQGKNYLELKPLPALRIGLFQMLALIRGTSRSGITLIGGLFEGLERKQALDYAFLASIPLFAILTVVEIVSTATSDEPLKASGAELAVGFVTALLSSLLVINIFRRLIRKPKVLAAFGVYRIALGLLVLLLLI
jgi:undecaprenyl-diphosphatase